MWENVHFNYSRESHGVKGEQQYAEREVVNAQIQEKDAEIMDSYGNLDDPAQREEYKRDCCFPVELGCCFNNNYGS